MQNTARDLGPSPVPLIGGADRARPIAVRHGTRISAAALETAVARLADRLPERGQVVNYCADRLLFLTALGAAMARGQITHLPNDRTPRALEGLVQAHPDIYCLTDGGPAPPGVPALDLADLTFADAAGGAGIAIPSGQLSAIVYTGGTTGKPTANAKTWGALMDGAWRIAESLGLTGAAGETIVATVPAQHMYGFELSVLVPLSSGTAFHSGRPFYPPDVAAAVAETTGAVLVTTPIHLKALVAAGNATPGVRKIVSATAPLPLALAEEAERMFDAPVMEIYGCSEAGSLAAREPVRSERWRTLIGVTLHRQGEAVFADVPYLPERIALHDAIELLSATLFELKGRSNDMVNIAGKRASLSGLNAILNEIPGVVDGVFHAPDHDAGEHVERLTALVVAPGLSEQTIRRQLRNRIDSAFQPRPLVLVDALPRTDTGKLTRAALDRLVRDLKTGRP